MNKLLLIDTFYFLHRSFHAFPKDMQNSSGEPTNMVFGFTQTLLDSISELNPTHIACGWESEDQPSFRKELFPEYQANRVPGDPEDVELFRKQLPRVIQIIEAFNIPRLVVNGFEGDDVLGTAATLASTEANVVISTSDQDLLQLIDGNVSVFRPARPQYVKKQVFDASAFIDKYGFNPDRMIDYKALRGDPSDNIPGVKGIGDKGAKMLLNQFKSIDEIYENLDKIESKSIRKKLEENKEAAFLSQQLATIVTNIPMEFDLKDCKVHDFDVNEVRAIFEELEFASLLKKLDKLEKVKAVKEKLNKEKEKKEVQGSLF